MGKITEILHKQTSPSFCVLTFKTSSGKEKELFIDLTPDGAIDLRKNYELRQLRSKAERHFPSKKNYSLFRWLRGGPFIVTIGPAFFKITDLIGLPETILDETP